MEPLARARRPGNAGGTQAFPGRRAQERSRERVWRKPHRAHASKWSEGGARGPRCYSGGPPTGPNPLDHRGPTPGISDPPAYQGPTAAGNERQPSAIRRAGSHRRALRRAHADRDHPCERPGAWDAGLVGVRSERFRRVTLTAEDVASLTVTDRTLSYDGDARLLRLGLQAYSLGIAYEFDPFFGLSISRVDPLPHQLEAVYEHLLKLPAVRFLLADDAGAGKTVMAGLLVRELKLRGLAERILVVCPANLAFQWQRELKEKFDEKFLVFKGGDVREQFGVNQWLEQKQIVTSLDLAKRGDVLPGLRQAHWDLVIVDEAHRMSARDEAHKSQRYRLGELLRDRADHILLLTATPHKGDPQNFTLFLQLLDRDAYADVRSIRKAMERQRAPFYLRRTKEAMIHFPERRADGRWAARPVFTKRIPRTAKLRHRRRGARPLPGGDAIREATEPARRGAAGRPQGAGGRVPDVPLPAPPRLQHLRHAPLARETGRTARRRPRPSRGPGAHGSARTARSGRPRRDGGRRTREDRTAARCRHPRRQCGAGARGGSRAPPACREGEGSRGLGRRGEARPAREDHARRRLLRPPRSTPPPLHRVHRHPPLPDGPGWRGGASASGASTAG